MNEMYNTPNLRVALRIRLEAKRVEGTITTDELLDLAALYVDEGPDDPYLNAYKEILKRDPQNVMARIWLAHFCTMLDYIPGHPETAASLVDELLPKGGETAAACYKILSTLYHIAANRTVDDRIAALEESVRLCSEWSSTRYLLAEEYAKRARFGEALMQMEAALTNTFGDFDPRWRPQTRLWETAMTGRVIADFSRKEMIEKIEDLRAKVERAQRREQIWRGIRRLWHWRTE